MTYFLLIVIALLMIVITAVMFYVSGKQEGYKDAQLEMTGNIKDGYIVVKNKIYSVSDFKLK